MRRRTLVVAAATVLAACGSPAPTRPTPPVTPTPQSVAPGTYAVVTTNASRSGGFYKVLLIDGGGRVAAQTTAALPTITPSIPLPLVSASRSRVYYLDGDSHIRALAPDGTTAAITTVAVSSTTVVAFAVSPDDARIAVARITEPVDTTQTSGQGYVEDLGTGAHHTSLFTRGFLFPLGWHGSDLVEAVGSPFGQRCEACPSAVASYQLVNPATGAVHRTLCKTADPQPSGGFDIDQVVGSAVPAGVACLTASFTYAAASGAGTMTAVDWSGNQTTFLATSPGTALHFRGYALAPDGSAVACNADPGGGLTLLPGGAQPPRAIGPNYVVLGWINPARLLVDINGATLGVVTVASGEVVAVPVPGADGAVWSGVLPGGL